MEHDIRNLTDDQVVRLLAKALGQLGSISASRSGLEERGRIQRAAFDMVVEYLAYKDGFSVSMVEQNIEEGILEW